MSDCLDSDRTWHNNAGFWKEFYHFIFDQSKEDRAEQEVDQIIALTGITSGRLLDIPCGPGRHSVAFAARGFDVTAVDINNDLLQRARVRSGVAGTEIYTLRRDMRMYCQMEAFDLAVNMFTSLGYFCDRAEDLRVVDNIHCSLVAGAKAVFEMVGREVLRKNFVPEITEVTDSGVICHKHLEPQRNWSVMHNVWELAFPDGRTLHTAFNQYIYSASELKQLLEDAGFTRVDLYGSLAGIPYGDEAKRLVAVAQR